MSILLNHNKPNTDKKSFGEIAFDGAVYGGIGYLANAALSVAVTHQVIHLPNSWLGRQGQTTHAMFEEVMKTVTDHPETIKRWTDRANDILFLSSGGWLLLIPMKWVEDNKLHLVQKIDHAFGTGPKTPQAQEQQSQRLENGAKQSYLSLYAGRAITYPLIVGAAIPVMTILKGNEHLNAILEKHASGFFNQFSHAEKVIDLTSQEIILAGTAAALLYGSSKAVAHLQHALKGSHAAPPQPDTAVQNTAYQGAAIAHTQAPTHPL